MYRVYERGMTGIGGQSVRKNHHRAWFGECVLGKSDMAIGGIGRWG